MSSKTVLHLKDLKITAHTRHLYDHSSIWSYVIVIETIPMAMARE